MHLASLQKGDIWTQAGTRGGGHMEMEAETETEVMFLQVKEHPGLPATT